MKAVLILLIVLTLAVAGAYIYIDSRGYSISSVLNSLSTYDLLVDCSDVNNPGEKSQVNVSITSTDRNHNSATVLLTAYDKTGERIGQKRTTFEKRLEARSI